MAAACGDDDGGDGGGGSGGQGASGGSGGSSGNGGSAGEAGSGGTTGGSAGQPNGGSGGSSGGGSGGVAGTAGVAGQAGSGPIVTDAGPDGSVVDPDASVPPDGGSSTPADSGVNGDCTGFSSGLTTIDPQNSQDVVIARVIFNEDGLTATAVLRVINAFAFGADQVLCWGATNSECASVDDGITGADSPVGAEILVEVGTADDPIDVDSGELLFAAETPENTPNVFSYVNWGDHTSADVDDAGPIPSLEGMADSANFWTLGESVTLDGDDNAFFGLGDTSVGAGFDGCTADQFPNP